MHRLRLKELSRLSRLSPLQKRFFESLGDSSKLSKPSKPSKPQKVHISESQFVGGFSKPSKPSKPYCPELSANAWRANEAAVQADPARTVALVVCLVLSIYYR